MRKTDVSNARNQDITHTTALTSDVMDVMKWAYYHGLFSFMNTCATLQDTQKLPHQIELKAPLGRSIR